MWRNSTIVFAVLSILLLAIILFEKKSSAETESARAETENQLKKLEVRLAPLDDYENYLKKCIVAYDALLELDRVELPAGVEIPGLKGKASRQLRFTVQPSAGSVGDFARIYPSRRVFREKRNVGLHSNPAKLYIHMSEILHQLAIGIQKHLGRQGVETQSVGSWSLPSNISYRADGSIEFPGGRIMLGLLPTVVRDERDRSYHGDKSDRIHYDFHFHVFLYDPVTQQLDGSEKINMGYPAY